MRRCLRAAAYAFVADLRGAKVGPPESRGYGARMQIESTTAEVAAHGALAHPALLGQQFADERAHVDALAVEIAMCASRLCCGEHELLTHIRRFDELKGWLRQGARSAAEWLSWRIGIGPVAAREKMRVAVALGALPKIDAALARGELSYCKVRAMTRVADADNEELLLVQARGTTGAELERICSGFRKVFRDKVTDEEHRYVRRRNMRDGTVQIEMRLLPDEAERVWQALSEHRLALRGGGESRGESEGESRGETETEGTGNDSAETGDAPTMADAAVAMAETSLAGLGRRDSSGADRRMLFVHLAERLLPDAESDEPESESESERERESENERENASWKAELQDGTSLTGESLLRLACDSGLIVAKTDDRGGVLDLGRRRRTVSPALMRAVRLRDRGCRFPGCNQRAFVDAHHIEHWTQGGATSLANVTSLCHRHHVSVHEGGFRVARDDDGELRFFRPDGAHIPDVAALPHSISSQDVAARLAERGRRLHAQATRPHGRGPSIELDGCIHALCRRRSARELHSPHEQSELPAGRSVTIRSSALVCSAGRSAQRGIGGAA